MKPKSKTRRRKQKLEVQEWLLLVVFEPQETSKIGTFGNFTLAVLSYICAGVILIWSTCLKVEMQGEKTVPGKAKY